ncbi:hypothetical protein [Roseibium sp. RKSG952]|uniref:hypothetical protein n=1 Tax=Roseibium sp. RKSG952 TaxID=2529384 RepID=UPI0012BBE47F|nr:hypothetical protein [Roseibium sp. RKSG952]MTH95522.1 hypothetical protein [Roseibium sp. RKSG952]
MQMKRVLSGIAVVSMAGLSAGAVSAQSVVSAKCEIAANDGKTQVSATTVVSSEKSDMVPAIMPGALATSGETPKIQQFDGACEAIAGKTGQFECLAKDTDIPIKPATYTFRVITIDGGQVSPQQEISCE